MNEVIVDEIIPRSKYETGIAPKIEEVFGAENVKFFQTGIPDEILCRVVSDIPKSFLDKFGTGNRATDEYIWTVQVGHTIAKLCRNGNYERKKRWRQNGK